MATDFTQRTAKAFDLLTVMVMLRECDPDLTMVDFIERSKYSQKAFWTDAPPTFTKHSSCLGCLRRKLTWATDHEQCFAAVVNAVRDGRIQILSIHERSELAPCRTCPPLKLTKILTE